MDGVLDAARALERAETVLEERIAKDRVRSAINLYDAQIARYAAALSGSSGGPDE